MLLLEKKKGSGIDNDSSSTSSTSSSGNNTPSLPKHKTTVDSEDSDSDGDSQQAGGYRQKRPALTPKSVPLSSSSASLSRVFIDLEEHKLLSALAREPPKLSNYTTTANNDNNTVTASSQYAAVENEEEVDAYGLRDNDAGFRKEDGKKGRTGYVSVSYMGVGGEGLDMFACAFINSFFQQQRVPFHKKQATTGKALERGQW